MSEAQWGLVGQLTTAFVVGCVATWLVIRRVQLLREHRRLLRVRDDLRARLELRSTLGRDASDR